MTEARGVEPRASFLRTRYPILDTAGAAGYTPGSGLPIVFWIGSATTTMLLS